MTRLTLHIGVSLLVVLLGGSLREARADCPYRTLTPTGRVVSSIAPENSLVCVAEPSPDCPQCQTGVQHQCIDGKWEPLGASACMGGPRVAEPPSYMNPDDLARPPGGRGETEERCIYYDRDGRRMQLSPDDLAWAKDNGLVADRKCY